MRVVAHLQAMEGDEVDLHAEAWATPRMPGPLRGASGKLPAAHPCPSARAPPSARPAATRAAPLVASSPGRMLAARAIDPLSASTSLLASLLPLLYVGGLVAAGLVVSFVLRRLAALPSFRQVHPWIPLLHLAVWLPLVWLLQSRLMPTLEGPTALTRGLLLAVLLVAALPWLRCVVLGVVFAIEARYKIGDDLRVGATEGRLVAVGLRAITLRTHDGTDATIPYDRLAAETVVRLNLRAHDTPCDLAVDVPRGIAPARAVELARQAAALSRFASPRCPPEVYLAARDHDPLALRLQIRGFLFDHEHDERFRSDLVERLHAAFLAERPDAHADRRAQ